MLCTRNLSLILPLGVIVFCTLANSGCQSRVVAKYHCEACVDEGVAQPEVWYVVEGRTLLGRETYSRKSVSRQQWEAAQVAKR